MVYVGSTGQSSNLNICSDSLLPVIFNILPDNKDIAIPFGDFAFGHLANEKAISEENNYFEATICFSPPFSGFSLWQWYHHKPL